jgi:hypothetical protein
MILVAAALVVIMAMAAMVIDVGAMVQERRELQNGADAAAMSVAHSCALGETACSTPTPAASAIAGSNGASIESVVIDAPAHTVTARTRNDVKFSFSPGQTTLHATAVATWGPPDNGTTIPLTLSKCEFDKAAFGATTVIFHTNSAATCNAGPAGKDLPGGFGWLDMTAKTGCTTAPAGKDLPGGFGWLDMTAKTGCTTAIDADSDASANTGVSAPSGCDLSALLGKTILVPIFDGAVRTGTNVTYHLAGFGAFVLTGYRFPSTSAGSPVPCKSPNTCIGGTFTEFVTDAGGVGGGNFGVSVIKLVR